MKRYLLLIISFFICMLLYAQTDFCTKYENEQIIKKTYLTISYNKEYKIPNYVGYYIIPKNLKGDAVREPSFYTETLLDKAYRSYSSNYTNSGYDRGHMSPAADWRSEQNAMHESFAMSNICPQCPSLNRYYWVKIENLERYYAYNCDTLYVITGSICDKKATLVFIKNKIRVPEYFYKAVIGIVNQQVIISQAWVYKNINNKQTPEESELSINELEKLIDKDIFTGFWFNEIQEDKVIKIN